MVMPSRLFTLLLPAIAGMAVELMFCPGPVADARVDDDLDVLAAADGSPEYANELGRAELAHIELAIDSAEAAWIASQIAEEERARRAHAARVVMFVKNRVALSDDEERSIRELVQPVIDSHFARGAQPDVTTVIRSHRVSGKLCVVLDEKRCIRILKDPAL
jgi:hypothetical protein